MILQGFWGDTIDLVYTSSDHYCIPFRNLLFCKQDKLKHQIAHHFWKTTGREKKAMTLHRQFSDVSKEKLYKLVKEGKAFKDAEFLKIIEKCCISSKVCTRNVHL